MVQSDSGGNTLTLDYYVESEATLLSEARQQATHNALFPKRFDKDLLNFLSRNSDSPGFVLIQANECQLHNNQWSTTSS